MKLMSFWSKFLIALAVTIFATCGVVVGVLAGQKEEINMGGTIKYSVPSYTVNFLNYDNTVFQSQTVSYGQDATRPTTNPVRAGYTFKDWTDFTNITADRNVASTWIKNEGYLSSSWQSLLASSIGNNTNIKTILFTADSTKIPSGVSPVSVGMTNAASTTAWSEGCGCFDVSAYVSPNSSDSSKYDIVFYCPYTIYAPEDSSYLFSDENDSWGGVTSISFNNFDTSKAKTMSNMFYFCSSLTNLDLSSFNTSNVTDMSYMFSDLYALDSINLSSFDTSNVTTMFGMFCNCEQLAYPNFSNFNTSNVTDMGIMFSGCSQLVDLNLSSFDTSKVTSMSEMFSGCYHLESVNISSFNTSNVTNMSYMFYGCESLETFNISNFNTSKVTNMSYMFRRCRYLTSLDLSSFNTSIVTNMDGMFANCSGLASLDVTSFNTINVTNMNEMFFDCIKLKTLDLSSFDMSNVTHIAEAEDFLGDCDSLIELKTPNAIGAKSAALPSSNWYDEDMNGAYSEISSSMLTDGSIILRPAYTIDLRAESPYWGPSTEEYRYFPYNGENFAYVYNGTTSLYGDELAYVNQDFSSTIARNANYIQLLSKDSSVWEAVEGLGTNATNGLRTTIYIWGNAEYSVRVPEGYFLEISEVDYEGNELSVLEYGNEYVNNSVQEDYYATIKTSHWAYKLELTLWHCTKNITASKVTTNELSNLYITLAQSEILNVYCGHPIPMPKVYVLGLDYSDYILDSNYQTTSTIGGTLHVDFNCGGYGMEAGAIIHYEVMEPTTYTLSIDSGNGMYDGKTGTNVIASGYAGQTFTIYKSLITVPDTYYFKELKQVSGSKGSLQGQIGTVSSESTTATYQLGAGNATVKLNVVRNSASYLRKDWKTVLENIDSDYVEHALSIEFTKQAVTNAANATSSISIGASAANGETAWTQAATGVNDIIVYVFHDSDDADDFGNEYSYYNLVFYSPITIYAPVDSSGLFSSIYDIETFTFYNFNTSKVTNMSYMFGDCMNVVSIDLSRFKTSKVTDMSSMFYFDGGNVTELDVSSFDTIKVTNMSLMFGLGDNDTLTSITFSSKFVTTSVTDMDFMFSGCRALTSLDLSSFDMTNVTSSSDMFSACKALTEITTPTTMGSVVAGLPNENVGYIWVDKTNQSQAYGQIDSTCEGKTLIMVAGPTYLQKNWLTALTSTNSNYTRPNIKTIEFTSTAPTGSGYRQVSVGATDATDATAWVPGTVGVADITAYVTTNSSDSTKYDIIFYAPGTIYAPVDSTNLFIFLDSTITFNNFNTSNVTNMAWMFWTCGMNTLDLSSFDTSKVTNMNGMFEDSEDLTYINLSSFDTSKVTNMCGMFSECLSLTSIDVSSFDTSKVTDMSSMFQYCTELTSIDVSSFDTSKVTCIEAIFVGCEKLTSLDISSFDLSKITDDASYMLEECLALTEIKTPKAMGSVVIDLPTSTLKSWFEEGTFTSHTQLNSTNTSKTLVLHANYAFLYKNYFSAIETSIAGTSGTFNYIRSFNSIVFTNTVPEISGTYKAVSVGATGSDGATQYSSRTGLEDITAYVTYTRVRTTYTLNTITFYSPVTMYMPTNASSLFNYSSLTELDFSCASFEFTTTATNTITSCKKLTEIKRPIAVGSANIVLPVTNGYQWQSQYNRTATQVITQSYENLPAVEKVGTNKQITLSTINLSGKKYTVSLDANGGTGGTTSITATYGSAMPTTYKKLNRTYNLTLPTRENYVFAGYGSVSSPLAISHIDNYDQMRRINFTLSSLAVGDKVAVTVRSSVLPTSIDFNDNDITTWTYYADGSNYVITINHTITSSDLSTRDGIDYSQFRFFDLTGITSGASYFSLMASIKGHFYYAPNGTSAKVYDIASDSTLYAQWVGVSTTATMTEDILSYTWSDVNSTYTSRFTNWQNNEGNLTVKTHGGGGWEARFIPVNLLTGTKYTWSFNYVMPALSAQYTSSVSAGRMRAQILTQVDDGDNLVNQVNTTSGSAYFELLSSASGTATLTFTPTSSGTYYLCLNFGYCDDETDLNFTFSNMKFNAVKDVNYNSTYGELPTPPNVEGYTFDGWRLTNSLFNFDDWLTYYNGSCSNGTSIVDQIAGTLTLTATGADCYTTPWNGNRSDIASYVTVSPNTSYVFSWKQSVQTSAVNNYIFFYDSPTATSYASAVMSEQYDSTTGRYYIAFTTPGTTTCLRFRFGLNSAIGTTLLISNVKLETGSTPTNDTIVSSTTVVSATTNHTLYAKMSPNAYLRKDWLSAITAKNSNYIGANIKTIEFTRTAPTGTGYTTVSVGANDENGTTAWTSSKTSVSDITAYIKANSTDSTKYDVIFYTPAIIYAPVDSSWLFSTGSTYMPNLSSISFDNFNTSKVTNMARMFSNCSSLTNLDLSNFNTSNTTSMVYMFFKCNELTNLDLSGFNTSKVTNMSHMFSNCSNLTSLNLSNFNTSSVTNMYGMFQDCSRLTSINISNFDTSSATNIGYMFQGCSGLTSLDLSGFNTSNVTTMYNLFYNCSNLTSLNISSFDTSNATNMLNMFYGCNKLTSLNFSNFDMSSISTATDMLTGCSALTEIKTPKAIKNGKTITLPTKSGYSWKGASGNIYTTISSLNLNKTLTLSAS